MVDVFASRSNYADHLLPIWRALGDLRGVFVPAGDAIEHCKRQGVRIAQDVRHRTVLVASAKDAERFREHRVIYVNHGVGQAWRDERGVLIQDGAGQPKPTVTLFLTPGPHATATTVEANPGARVVEVGSPRVDALRGLPPPTEPLLVVSSHWNHRLVPESKYAIRHYLDHLRDLPIPVALHSHPRISTWMRPNARALGVEYIETFHEVCQRATVYAVDTSSTLFEFAALDRPVIVLNSPNYRRGHSHGLRFWDAATVGVNVNDPSELPNAIRQAVKDTKRQQAARRKAVRMAYRLDGNALDRTITAIREEVMRGH